MVTPAMPRNQWQRQISMDQNSYGVFNSIRMVWSSLPWAATTKRNHQQQSLPIAILLHLSQALKDKQPEYLKRHDKVVFHHNNARPHLASRQELLGKAQMGNSTLPAVLSRRCSPSDYHLFRLMTHSLSEQWLTLNENCRK